MEMMARVRKNIFITLFEEPVELFRGAGLMGAVGVAGDKMRRQFVFLGIDPPFVPPHGT